MRATAAASARALGVHARLEIHQRFAGNALGVLWTAIVPLLQLALFALVFVHIFKARDPGIPGVGYLEFLAIGMWPWLAFSEAVTRAGGALVENSALISKVRLDPWHLVFARVVVAFGFHGAGFVLVLATLSLTGVSLHVSALLGVLCGWGLLLVLALAIGMVMSLAVVFIRDLQQLLPQVLTALLFLSPILYPAKMAPDAMRRWLEWNPIGVAIDLIRDGLLTGSTAEVGGIGASIVVAASALAAWGCYLRLRTQLADYL